MHCLLLPESPLEASVGVPLAVAGPGVVGRNLCDDSVIILDLHATFLEVAGADPSNDADSRSMAPYLREQPIVLATSSSRDWARGGWPSMVPTSWFLDMIRKNAEVERNGSPGRSIPRKPERSERTAHLSSTTYR